MFTTKNTMQEILADAALRRYLPLFVDSFILNAVPETLYGEPLEALKARIKMPWGAPFLAEEVAHAANLAAETLRPDGAWQILPLWPGPFEPAGRGQEVCLIAPRLEKSEKRRPAAILAPGGAYMTLSMTHEGTDEAAYLAGKGFQPYVLHYRVTPNYYPAPQEDLALTILYLRANAEALGVDPNNILVMGSSAGGHLAASIGALHEQIKAGLLPKLPAELAAAYAPLSARPDKICLSYGALLFARRDDQCYRALVGPDQDPDEVYDLTKGMTADFPPTFAWACEDDPLVPYTNATLLDEALTKAGVAHQVEIHPTGGHGAGMAEGTAAAGWMERMLAFFGFAG